ncbi:MAG: YfiR family protein [Cyclobacteriaceae bacterium]|nr:YfiR family protein [Cyclobacteriaceae bacterium]
MYNFSKYVKWPDNMNSGKFVIGVLGSSVMHNELKAMAASKNVNGLPIEVRQFNSVAEVRNCHIFIWQLQKVAKSIRWYHKQAAMRYYSTISQVARKVLSFCRSRWKSI